MQAVGETIFDVVYLALVIFLGILMIKDNEGQKQYLLFGIMAVVLGGGDAFHLIPRAWALCTTGLADYTAALGIGKLITSITMTVFYILLYYVWRLRYRVQGQGDFTLAILGLAAARIVLCLLPQNEWTSADPPLLWGVLRNIPFAIMGIVVIVLYYRAAKEYEDYAFRWMWLAVVLSFAFYIPVVLFSSAFPVVGVLMIPKTLAYVWIVCMGFFAMRYRRLPYFTPPRVR